MKEELLKLYQDYIVWIIDNESSIRVEADNFYPKMIIIAKIKFATFDGFMTWLELNK